ncbi:mandelate racemase/muconate lactonizing enzyme family protein [Microbacterium sp. p3-SID338]|uniref:mandelate racemase/muconate lactonizing enzyme family protein n=1 Tax=unclassified Microbacterium TaxID=2609290 RepID=UPI000C8050DF|nr:MULTISPECIES: mandelate racemase/muconate lactonizing enzyme family protein [unclassified Microbacterium]MCT1397151.1 mandelate racemase/muconate lactonizing enzyme family protein [Microbacterium sp. p3-SID338]PMC05133.1 uroporphyrinogen decarboxylase [Microbacterium sp. UMB0228]
MAKITNVRTDLYRVPLATRLSDSTHGDMDDFELVVVRVTDADGASGMGYTYTVNAGGHAVARMVDPYLSDVLVGEDADRIEALWQKMWWHLHYAGRGGHVTSAISAVDIALWDLKGRRLGQPLWRVFGGYDPVVPVYAGGIDLQFSVPQLLAQADDFRAQGFRAIKMKVGREELREDLVRVAAMREHLGDGFPLMVDANMRWSADRAIAAARELRAFDLVWLEEPVIPDDLPGQARVLASGGLPIAAGENLHTLYEFRAAIDAGAVTYPEPDVSNCGGMTVFRKVASLAEAHNLPVTSHGVHDLTVHCLAAAPNRTYMEAHGFSLEPYLAETMPIVGGAVTAPERPGHGLDLDFEKLATLRA